MYRYYTAIIIHNLLLYIVFIKHSAGTPLSMDQFGWNSDEVVLKYGIIMAGIGIIAFIGFFTVGPLSARS